MNSKLEMYSIFDAKAKAYIEPFFSINDETARREFAHTINGEGAFNEFTEDYALFSLGTFDQTEGVFDIKSPSHVANGVTLKTVQPFPMTNSPRETQANWDQATAVHNMKEANKS